MVNHDPIFLTDPSPEAMSHVLYFQEFIVFDRNPIDRIVVEIINGPDFLSWDDMRFALVGTPLTEHIGSYLINLSARDGKGGVAYLEYTLVVANNPVRLKNNPLPDLDEGDELIHIVPYVNKDDDDLHWTIDTTASFIEIGESDGILRGIPDDPDIGKHWIRIMVDDGRGATDSVNYTFEVFNLNDAPRILTEDVTSAYEDELYWVEYECLDPDPDGNQQEWYMRTDAEFLKCNKLTGSVHGTPTEDDIGTYTMNISVRDIHGEWDYHEFILKVLNVNDAPVIVTDQPHDTVKQEEEYRFEFQATDSDPTNDVLTWTVETNATFLSMDPGTGVLKGRPGNEDVGGWEVKVIVTDPLGGNDTLKFSIWVEDANDEPVFTIQELPDATEDEPYNVMITAYDPDHPPDLIEFSIDLVGSFLSIDPLTGELSGTPEQKDVGVLTFNISITDEEGVSTTRQFSLTVVNVNDAPVPLHMELQIPIEEDTVDFKIILGDLFTDVDGDILSYLMDMDDDHIEAEILENGTMIVNPEQDWNGIVRFNLSTTDGELSAVMILILKITPKNDAPRDLEVTYKERYGFNEKQACSATGSDPDLVYGDVLFYSWYDEDQVRIATGSDVELDLSPGKHMITVKAADKDGLETTKVIEITIEEEDPSAGVLVIIAVTLLLMAIAGSGIFFFVSKKRRTRTKEKKQEDDFFLPKQPPTSLETEVQIISTGNEHAFSQEMLPDTAKTSLKTSLVKTSFEPDDTEDNISSGEEIDGNTIQDDPKTQSEAAEVDTVEQSHTQ